MKHLKHDPFWMTFLIELVNLAILVSLFLLLLGFALGVGAWFSYLYFFDS